MTSKEQYSEFENWPDLPTFEKIRKRKPWDDKESRRHLPHLDARRASMPNLLLPKPLLEWTGFRKLVEDWDQPNEKSILEMFIANHGPMAVARGIKQELEFIRNDKKSPREIVDYMFIRAYGTTFERLACYWLKTITDEPRKILDVGSTQIVARAVKTTSGIHIYPDGLILNYDYNPPLLEAACEYKTNPNDPRSNKDLNRQLIQLTDFFTILGNKILYAKGGDRFYLDRRADWVVREIRIASRPSIVLVIPQDRHYESSSEFVEIRKAPFSMDQLRRIALTLLQDINRIVFIEQELSLFDERRQKYL